MSIIAGKLLAFVVLAAMPGAALACDCGWYQRQGGKIVALPVPPPLTKEELGRYAAVFTGRVVALTLRQTPHASGAVVEDIEVSVVVFDALKATIRGQIALSNPLWGPACGYSFSLGETYLFFLDPTEPGHLPRVEMCSRTQVLAKAQADRDAVVSLSASVH